MLAERDRKLVANERERRSSCEIVCVVCWWCLLSTAVVVVVVVQLSAVHCLRWYDRLTVTVSMSWSEHDLSGCQCSRYIQCYLLTPLVQAMLFRV